MAETEAETEPVDDEEEPTPDDLGEEADDIDEESKPEVDDEATIDIDLDAVNDDLEDDATDDEADTDESTSAGAIINEGGTMGDMYVRGLVATSNAVIEKHDGEPIGEQMARDLGLDRAMNEWVRQRGATEDLPPGQALVIGTSIIAMSVLASNPEIVGSVLEVVE
ncbi:hypothetical protein HALLA_09655 [Halostagnicola larsenii XH-48]|uniref:Uncharacterized protein n=1 Tax=Halostagnicola larsenii XH-48 TaxID=797299 RepID=W0JPH3_9EURY|nr:hypothetical protein [Halostagnicola larsenii]AHF99061.1 hypothetical protein HALLA_09490 [Halostagnicola larsenii XH-48]AHF99074.1 hypothetical protein HALLA_09655 [Halostagnicola larsenii XH-48]